MGKLLASQDSKIRTVFRGQQVEGEVVELNDKEITLDLGGKSEGILQRKELNRSVNIGDKIKAFVSMAENENGQVTLSSSAQVRPLSSGRVGFRSDWSKFKQAQSNKSKLSGSVMEVNKGGLIVEVDGIRGFLPNSQVGFELLSKSQGGMETLIGQSLALTVIEIDQGNNKLIFSQRGQVSDEIKEKLSGFKKGEKVSGKIVAILPFGLVVDVNGVEGLVFISDVAWEKVEELESLYKNGQEIEIMVTGLDEELGRLNLSIKHLQEDPFAKLTEKFPADEVVKGEVLAVDEGGVTVKLDGAEGLLQASKMGSTKFEVGKTVTLLVDSVDPRKGVVNLAPMITSTEGLIYK